MFKPSPKLEFQKFEEADPKGWLVRAEQYFDFINVEDTRKVKVAGIHFEGRAAVCLRFYVANRGMVDWRVFVNNLMLRFEDPDNRDVRELFNKLRQT